MNKPLQMQPYEERKQEGGASRSAVHSAGVSGGNGLAAVIYTACFGWFGWYHAIRKREPQIVVAAGVGGVGVKNGDIWIDIRVVFGIRPTSACISSCPSSSVL